MGPSFILSFFNVDSYIELVLRMISCDAQQLTMYFQERVLMCENVSMTCLPLPPYANTSVWERVRASLGGSLILDVSLPTPLQDCNLLIEESLTYAASRSRKK